MIEGTFDLATYIGNKQVREGSRGMTVKPEKMGTRHMPVPHRQFYQCLANVLYEQGFEQGQTAHALLAKNSHYFGMCELEGFGTTDYGVVLAWQASHNQRIAATLHIGAALKSTELITLSTEVRLHPKQIANMADRMPELMAESMERIRIQIDQQNSTFKAFKSITISVDEAERAMVEMIRRDVVSAKRSALMIAEWDSPTDGTRKRSIWRLFTAGLATLKPAGNTDAVKALVTRSTELTDYCKEMALDRL